jgi:glycosyltransferase involved in cell wall biosynthesis
VKIALVCDWYRPRVGGIERHLEQLAQQLARAGHEVTVITPTPGPAEGPQDVKVIRVAGGRLPVIGLVWTPGTFARVGAELQRGGFEMVHVHASMISPAAYAAVRAACRLKLPTVLTLHSMWGEFRHAIGALDFLLGWTKWRMVFSAVSERAGEDLQRLLPAGTTVRVLSNAIDLEEWSPGPESSSGEFIVAAVMRLAPRKRVDRLLRIARQVKDRSLVGERVRFQIAGDGPQAKKLREQARAMGLADTVEFLGDLDQAKVRALFARSRLFILPSELESFGLAALEARAAGLPVLAMASSGVSGWLKSGVEGLLATDEAQLTEQVMQLITDKALRDALATHNRTTPVRYTWANTLREHEVVYAEAKRSAG